MDLGIKGRRALVTGAAGGIGSDTVKRLSEAGVVVLATDVEEDSLDGLRDLGGVTCRAADLSSAEGIESFLKPLDGPFDIWVHAAGVTGAKGDPVDMSEEAWQHALNIDFLSAVRMARTLCPSMISNGWGRIVFVTSENVAQPYPDETVYNASKSALLSYAKSLAMQHSKSGMLVNCVAPAFIETPMTDGMMKERAEEEGVSFDEAVDSFLQEERPYLVLGRRGKPEEVGPVIAFLCSALASFVTGANWRVDGGAVGSINV